MLIDVNVSMGRWPFQDFSRLTPAGLWRHLSAAGISRAVVSPVEAILAPEPETWNRRLAAALQPIPELLFVPVINPRLADWRTTVKRHLENAAVPAFKIYPNYHLYSPDDPVMDAMADCLASAGRPLMIQVRLDDERNQYPLMRVPGVDVDAIVRLANRHPRLRLICLGLYLGQIRHLIAKTGNVLADIAFAETFETIKTLLDEVPARRLLFGSHTPFFETRAAVMKIELAAIACADRKNIACTNAQSLWPQAALFKARGKRR